jgi:hypothetical protein
VSPILLAVAVSALLSTTVDAAVEALAVEF